MTLISNLFHQTDHQTVKWWIPCQKVSVKFSSHSAEAISALEPTDLHSSLHTDQAQTKTNPLWHPPGVYVQPSGSGPHGAGSALGRHGASWWSPQWCHQAGFQDQWPHRLLIVSSGGTRETINWIWRNKQHEVSTQCKYWRLEHILQGLYQQSESPSTSGASSHDCPFTNTFSWTAASKFCKHKYFSPLSSTNITDVNSSCQTKTPMDYIFSNAVSKHKFIILICWSSWLITQFTKCKNKSLKWCHQSSLLSDQEIKFKDYWLIIATIQTKKSCNFLAKQFSWQSYIIVKSVRFVIK